MVLGEHEEDLERLLMTQGQNGGPFWSTADGALAKGTPFSTLEAGLLLAALGLPPDRPEVAGIAGTIFQNQKADGRIKVYPTGSVYPCQTANAARTLCYLGYARDPRLAPTFAHLLGIQEKDGGWRCNSFKYGRGPETEASNPGPTLAVLDVFRLAGQTAPGGPLDRAVEFLLSHWETRAPLGPCHYGIGTLFFQVEYPLVRYNLLMYVFVLSFYPRARGDRRFLEAWEVLKAKLVDGMLVLENPNRKLAAYRFARKGEKNALATRCWRQIQENLG